MKSKLSVETAEFGGGLPLSRAAVGSLLVALAGPCHHTHFYSFNIALILSLSWYIGLQNIAQLPLAVFSLPGATLSLPASSSRFTSFL